MKIVDMIQFCFAFSHIFPNVVFSIVVSDSIHNIHDNQIAVFFYDETTLFNFFLYMHKVTLLPSSIAQNSFF